MDYKLEWGSTYELTIGSILEVVGSGNGFLISSRHDVWIGEWPLSIQFPIIYIIVRAQDGLASSRNLWWSNNSLRFSLHSIYPRVGCRVNLQLLWSHFQEPIESESRWLGQAEFGEARVLQSWDILSCSLGFPHGRHSNEFPLKNHLESQRVLTKVAFFIWKAFQGNPLTIDNLQKRRKEMANKCYLRK